MTTFLFYDLETSGLNPREDRIMQFAGQRTDMELNPVGEPYNLLVRLDDDTLPSPDAIMVTGITPQKTVEEGYSEAEFAKILLDEVFTPDTIAVGYNNIRFDDEFIRHLFWRTFRDPYEWAWKDGRSRWDLLDVVRMTRALRPDGIEWPFKDDGTPVNKLELLTKINGIAHEAAHDALSDVTALIEVTQLIKSKQPQLFDYLLKMRDKGEVKKLVNLDDKKPFVYSSGRYDSQYLKTTVAFPLTSGKNGNVVVYDLRHDPADFVNLSVDELKKRLYATYQERQAKDFVAIPVKELQYNRAPAVAPLGVLESGEGWQRVGLRPEIIERHMKALLAAPHFAENIRSLYESRPEFAPAADPEAQLYDGFLSDKDRLRTEKVREFDEADLADFHPDFSDERLAPLLLHYKARNYPRALSETEMAEWETWRSARITRQLPAFVKALERIAATARVQDNEYILSELQLWAESIVPSGDE